MKKTLLERFGLPVEIVAGDIGTLSVTIPWTQLKTQPVKINIDDVYVLARARPQGKVDPAEDERVEQATKQERLKSAEAVDSAASQVGSKGASDASEFALVGTKGYTADGVISEADLCGSHHLQSGGQCTGTHQEYPCEI